MMVSLIGGSRKYYSPVIAIGKLYHLGDYADMKYKSVFSSEEKLIKDLEWWYHKNVNFVRDIDPKVRIDPKGKHNIFPKIEIYYKGFRVIQQNSVSLYDNGIAFWSKNVCPDKTRFWIDETERFTQKEVRRYFEIYSRLISDAIAQTLSEQLQPFTKDLFSVRIQLVDGSGSDVKKLLDDYGQPNSVLGQIIRKKSRLRAARILLPYELNSSSLEEVTDFIDKGKASAKKNDCPFVNIKSHGIANADGIDSLFLERVTGDSIELNGLAYNPLASKSSLSSSIVSMLTGAYSKNLGKSKKRQRAGSK